MSTVGRANVEQRIMAKKQESPRIEHFTFQQAGDYLGKSAEAMRMACRRGQFASFKVNGRTFISKRDIDAVFDAARVAGGAK